MTSAPTNISTLDLIISSLNIPYFGYGASSRSLQTGCAAYSLAARRLLASLWDGIEGEVSVQHAKRAFSDTFYAVNTLWRHLPDARNECAAEPSATADAVFTLYEKCGFLYRKPNYVRSAPLRWTQTGHLMLSRGLGPGIDAGMAGALPFLLSPQPALTSVNRVTPSTFFGKPSYSDRQWIQTVIARAQWSAVPADQLASYEFLRLKDFSRGYWSTSTQDIPHNLISVARTFNAPYQYYLCRQKTLSGNIQFSALSHNVVPDLRLLAINAIREAGSPLMCYVTPMPKASILPHQSSPVTYSRVTWNYLPPQWLHNALRLSGWPFPETNPDFGRIIPDDILQFFLPALEEEGFLIQQLPTDH